MNFSIFVTQIIFMKNNFFKYFLPLVIITCLGFSKPSPLKTTKTTTVQTQKKYRYRKYNHVKKFYKRLAKPVTDLCMEHRVPPGAVLSILSLESGWGQGYIGNITGNFLSLNATRRDAELPALRMPKNKKTGKIILNKKTLAKTNDSLIVWQDRPSSLKKDYRPIGIAGTKKNLDYFLNHPNELTEANLKNVSDFVSRFISKTSSIKAYREARELLDVAIEKHGIEILFDDALNQQFVNTIGGRQNSYNFRKTWPTKVLNIYKNVGANTLAKQLYIDKQDFETVW